MGHRGRNGLVIVVSILVGALAACTGSADSPSSTTSSRLSPQSSPSGTTSQGSASAAPAGLLVVPKVKTTVHDVTTGLAAPWGLAALPDGNLLISERDKRRLLVVDPGNGDRSVVTGPGADNLSDNTKTGGEAGLLGVAVGTPSSAAAGEIFIYRTTSKGNEVLRGHLDGHHLGDLTTIVKGIPSASTHDGGRIAFGPDGYLYIGTGDATKRNLAQDKTSAAGKILRVTVEGKPAPGNPFSGSPVWSYGHRNVEGLGWDATKRFFASEFGQDDWDELNIIVKGGNYGWPVVEGRGDNSGSGLETTPGETTSSGNTHYIDPLVQWPTDEASPSGIAVTREGVYLAALRGQRLWRVPFARGVGQAASAAPNWFAPPQSVLDGLGRLRAVIVDPKTPQSPDGSSALYVLTNNTDGRGTSRAGDDRLVRVEIAPEH